MKLHLLGIASVFAFCGLVRAGDQPKQWYGHKPLQGHYQVYGGTLSEKIAPTSKDRKLAFLLKGPLAKDLFHQIGPDLKESCSSAEDYRERRRGDIDCVFTKAEGYSCYFGIDVVTGKSTNGAIC